MKKILVILLSAFSCLLLTACDPGSYYFDQGELEETVIGIELIDYDNSDQRRFLSWVPNHFPDLKPMDVSAVTVVEPMDLADTDEFLTQLSQVYFLYLYYCYDSPKGICIRMWYANGEYEIIWANYEKETFAGYVGRYSAEGEVVDFIGSFCDYRDFESLVEDYFAVDLSDYS